MPVAIDTNFPHSGYPPLSFQKERYFWQILATGLRTTYSYVIGELS